MASLTLPASDSTVRLRAIDAKMIMAIHSRGFIEPQLAGFEILNMTTVCYFIEHPKLNKRILFDCGGRKDFENYSPMMRSRLNNIIKGLKIEVDVNDVLADAGYDLESIDSLVWSHWHWDHHGAAEKFPKSVEIVVGAGFKDNFLPGYPTNPDAALLDADFEGRELREIDFTGSLLQIGKFAAFDFFGDGSFYLLDSPGHAIGHMCGLARTTPTTFVFLGADICHFAGMFRPSSGVPFPDQIPGQYLDVGFPNPCPCSFFTSQHPKADPKSDDARTTPFFDVTSNKPSSYYDRDQAMESIRFMQDFDASPDVLVCIAHDPNLLKILPMLNDQPDKDLNDWQARGYKNQLTWPWLNELPRDGKPGRPTLIDGAWRDGKQITDFLALESSR